jgi:hypothetical protein
MGDEFFHRRLIRGFEEQHEHGQRDRGENEDTHPTQ